jgi:hypothetical protein
MMGWDTDVLTQATETCTNLSGELTDCAVFSPTLQSEATQGECKLESVPALVALENVVGGLLGSLTALPGNVQIQAGPAAATVGGSGGSASQQSSSTYVAPTLTYASLTKSVPGNINVELSSSTSAASSTLVSAAAVSTPTTASEASATPTIEAVSEAAPAASTTPAPTSAPDPNVSYEAINTEYKTNGAMVEEVIWEEAVVYVTEDTVATVTVEARSPVEPRQHQGHLFRHRYGRRS